jgi:hypothetical protein
MLVAQESSSAPRTCLATRASISTAMFGATTPSTVAQARAEINSAFLHVGAVQRPGCLTENAFPICVVVLHESKPSFATRGASFKTTRPLRRTSPCSVISPVSALRFARERMIRFVTGERRC